MKFQYHGTPFIIEVNPGETVDQCVNRLLTEQHGVQRPQLQLLRSAVALVKAIEQIDYELQEACETPEERAAMLIDPLVTALIEIARQTHHLVKL